MTNLMTNSFAKTVKTAKKNWLYVQEADAASLPSVPGWNEGYIASNKFLYFSEAVSTATERELVKTGWVK